MNQYVEIPRAEIETLLTKAGFAPSTAGNELVYTRTHDKDPRLSISVYTSIATSATDARPCGQDAIRVVALFRWKHASGEERRKNLYKSRVYRVNSVEGVVSRTLERMREAYAACNEFRKGASR